MGISVIQMAKQRGSALVEAVLVIPILLMLIGTTYELGAVFQQYLIIQQMAYEGARSGSQLEKDAFTAPSCYSVNTSGYIRDPDTPSPSGYNPALIAVLARVEALITQYQSVLSLKCDDRLASNRCDTGDSTGLPSYAAEYLPTDADGETQPLNCGYPAPPYNPAMLAKKGTIGVKVGGKYTGRVFPFSIYLAAESRSLLLSGNQDYAPPRDEVPSSNP